MKKLSKLVLVLFSVIILIIGVVINLLVIGWLDYDTAFSSDDVIDPHLLIKIFILKRENCAERSSNL